MSQQTGSQHFTADWTKTDWNYSIPFSQSFLIRLRKVFLNSSTSTVARGSMLDCRKIFQTRFVPRVKGTLTFYKKSFLWLLSFRIHFNGRILFSASILKISIFKATTKMHRGFLFVLHEAAQIFQYTEAFEIAEKHLKKCLLWRFVLTITFNCAFCSEIWK